MSGLSRHACNASHLSVDIVHQAGKSQQTSRAPQPVRKQQATSTKPKTARREQLGWSALTAEETITGRPVSQYVRNAQQPADISDPSSFPAVGSSASGPSQQERAAKARLAGSLWQSPGETRAREAHQGSAADSLRMGGSAARQTPGHQHTPAALATDSHAVQSLESMHPWADTALLEVGCLSLSQDMSCSHCMLSGCPLKVQSVSVPLP